MIPPSASTIRRGRANPTAERGERGQAYVVNGIARDLELLDMLETEDVASMRFLNASDATTRFGIGHAAAPSS